MWALLITSLLLPTPVEIDVKTLDDKTISGSIVGLDTGRLTLKTSMGVESIATDNLLSITQKHPKSGPENDSVIWIDLSDGSAVKSKSYTTKGNLAEIAFDIGVVTLPTKTINAVRFNTATNSLKEEWANIRQAHPQSDLLVIQKSGSLDYHEGVIGDVSDKIVQFTLNDDSLRVKRSKVFGLIYYNVTEQSQLSPTCWVTLSNGSRWAAKTYKLMEQALHWTTPTGVSTKYPVTDITKIDFSQGKVVYLSDLTPKSTNWLPYFDTAEKSRYRREFFAPSYDFNLSGEPLLLDKKRYQKGLAVHSHTKIVYKLPDGFRRFKATVGIDDSVRPKGNVRLVITGNKRILYNSIITGSDAPKELEFDIVGIKNLSILVDFGKDLDISDHLDLCEARLVK